MDKSDADSSDRPGGASALDLIDGPLAICRLDADAPMPGWASGGAFLSLTRTSDELSVVCDERLVSAGVRANRGWRALKVRGPLDLTATGILAGLAGALAAEGVALFAASTFDTDYLLVHEADVEAAIGALTRAGWVVSRG